MNVLSSTDEGVVNTSLLQRLIRDVGSMFYGGGGGTLFVSSLYTYSFDG